MEVQVSLEGGISRWYVVFLAAEALECAYREEIFSGKTRNQYLGYVYDIGREAASAGVGAGVGFLAIGLIRCV